MGEEAEHFRSRARQCRNLARDARNPADRETLGRMADDLEAEADLIDSGKDVKPNDD